MKADNSKILHSVNSLHCYNLSKSFAGVHALVNVSFEFPSVGIVAIIGPNGAGKTTLLNVLTGFTPCESGKITFVGKNLTHMSLQDIARLGISRTFQNRRLVSQLTTIENLLLACPNQKGERFRSIIFPFGVYAQETRNRNRAMYWLELVGLEKKANNLAGELSYGEQKILTIACSLSTGAGVLFLDEPVAGVHPELISVIVQLLKIAREEEKVVIFVEHDMAAVREIANTVIVMDNGRIIAHGSPDDILECPELMEAYIT